MNGATAETAFATARVSERHPLVILRIAAGWTQGELARRSCVSMRAIQVIEKRHVSPYMATRRRLLEALGVPLSRHRELFGEFTNRRVKSAR